MPDTPADTSESSDTVLCGTVGKGWRVQTQEPWRSSDRGKLDVFEIDYKQNKIWPHIKSVVNMYVWRERNGKQTLSIPINVNRVQSLSAHEFKDAMSQLLKKSDDAAKAAASRLI